MTLAAALEDSRFPPLRRDETDIEIEISVVDVPEAHPVALGDFEFNQHGAMLEAGFCRGLLLPQVAPEFGWNAEQSSRRWRAKWSAHVGLCNEPPTQATSFAPS